MLTPMQQVGKKSRELISNEYNRLISAAKDCNNVIVLDTENLPTKHIQILRDKLRKIGKIIKSKKKFMIKALELYKETKFNLTEKTHLLFVSEDIDSAVEILKNYNGLGHLKSGDILPETLTLEKGVLKAQDVPISTVNKKNLEELGIPILVQDDFMLINEDFTICKEGDVADPRIEKILKIFKIRFPIYKVKIISVISKN